ncbi:hypothetical protein C1H76_8031 [Elsinoe australis]|uniref:Phytanoyl-CoA dioxygenase n=1 Tax=Elsinoe australis TaxID=40998 RepID=A0A4U7ANZ1_9PEZI|nr:hypothetical protein C1H76_8031 [Elsinoe australis]
MSATQTQELSDLSIGVLKLTGADTPLTGWQADLARDGYAVVKGAVPKERAAQYAERMHEYLEGFGLGYDRNDRSTWKSECLPEINNKGMCLDYAVAHEDFVWDVRAEPGVVGVFEEVLGTEDLIVSFDAVNFGLSGRKDLPPNKPWPHQDQDPKKAGFRCLQGLVNILPNGPNDGGLIVCKGGHQYSEQFHKEMAWEDPIPAWNPEWYGFTEKGMQWLADKGLEWVKVSAEPGDLLLWDSRTPHYNLSSTTDQSRFCIYTCYMPVADASQEDLKRKKTAFEGWFGTTHWPNCQVMGRNQAKRDGELDPHNRTKPVKPPHLSERAYKLTGIPYIEAEA